MQRRHNKKAAWHSDISGPEPKSPSKKEQHDSLKTITATENNSATESRGMIFELSVRGKSVQVKSHEKETGSHSRLDQKSSCLLFSLFPRSVRTTKHTPALPCLFLLLPAV